MTVDDETYRRARIRAADSGSAAVGGRPRTGFSIWDSALIAAASMLGCHTLLTEDMQDGQVIDGVRILNPFI